MKNPLKKEKKSQKPTAVALHFPYINIVRGWLEEHLLPLVKTTTISLANNPVAGRKIVFGRVVVFIRYQSGVSYLMTPRLLAQVPLVLQQFRVKDTAARGSPDGVMT